MPAPVMKRNKKNDAPFHAAPVRAVAVRLTAMVVKNSFFRPSLSVSQPKKRAPRTAPER